MPADGLIKTLIKQKNDAFMRQLNLINISDKLNLIGPNSDNEDRRRGVTGSVSMNTADPRGVCKMATLMA